MISNFARGFQKFHFFWCWIQTIVFGWQELLHSKIWKKNMAVQVAPVGKTMKVKVVKWCRKKWNKPNLMHIYHKQSEIMQKIQWNSSNGQLHWFLIDFLRKWPIMESIKWTKTMQTQTLFSLLQKKSRYPGYESWRPGGFLCYNYLNRTYCCSKSGQISRFFFCKVAS